MGRYSADHEGTETQESVGVNERSEGTAVGPLANGVYQRAQEQRMHILRQAEGKSGPEKSYPSSQPACNGDDEFVPL